MRFLAQAPPPLQLRTPPDFSGLVSGVAKGVELVLETIYDEIHYTASSVHLRLPDFLGTVVCTRPLLINCSRTIAWQLRCISAPGSAC